MKNLFETGENNYTNIFNCCENVKTTKLKEKNIQIELNM